MNGAEQTQIDLALDHEIYLWAQWQAAKHKVRVQEFISEMIAAQYAQQTAPAN